MCLCDLNSVRGFCCGLWFGVVWLLIVRVCFVVYCVMCNVRVVCALMCGVVCFVLRCCRLSVCVN